MGWGVLLAQVLVWRWTLALKSARACAWPMPSVQGVEDQHVPGGTGLLEVTSGRTAVTAIKRAEDRDTLIVRLYNITGVTVSETLTLGRAAAGVPIMAVENREGILSLEDLFGRDDVFAVRVAVDSMKDVGILDGDLAIVRRSETVPSGSIAVCYLGDDQEVTVKRLKRRKDGFELAPENKAYRPIRIATDDPGFRVGGAVIGVVRRMG